MSTEALEAPYIVVVNTNMYAGNFERDLTAYCTGEVGECEVGDDKAELFREEVTSEQAMWFEDALLQVADDRGTQRPCSMWDSKGNSGYKDVAMFFHGKPTKEMLELIRDRAIEFANEGYRGKMKISSVSLIERVVTTKDTILMELL